MFLEVRGLRLHAIERGDGEPSVLLHGWLDHAHSFDRLAPLLPGRTLAFDFRGHGDSGWVGPGGFYHLVEYVADLDGALDALGLGPVRIVGHSLGATVGLLYAAARPGRVQHLTLLDGAPLAIAAQEIPARMTEWLDDLRGSRARRKVESVQDAVRRMRRFNSSMPDAVARLLAEHGVSPDPAQGGGLAWKWDPLLRAHSPLPVTEDAVRLLVAQVKSPVLALRGEHGILQEEADLRQRFPSLPLEMHTVPGAGHHLHIEAPEACAAQIGRAWR